MKKTITSLIIAFFCAELFSAPKLIAEAETNTPIRLLTVLSETISRISPENAGNFILFSAMLTMNPKSSVLDMDRPIQFALLTSGEAPAMPFPVLSASLKQQMIPAGGCIPFMGINWKILQTENGRSLLCPDHPQFERHWKRIKSLCFKRPPHGGNIPLLILRIHPEAIRFSAQMLRQTLKKDPIVDTVVAILEQELGSFSMNMRFPKQGMLHAVIRAGFRKGTFPQRGKYSLSFPGSHSFPGADFFITAKLPLSSESKCRIISITDRMGIPRLPQECIMRSDGTFVSAINMKKGIRKFTIGLEKNSGPILENILREDRTIPELPSGLRRVFSMYLRIRNDRAVFVSGTSSEAEAAKIMMDRTPFPEVQDKSIRGIFIEPDPNGIRMEMRLNMEDFPKPENPYSSGTPTG